MSINKNKKFEVQGAGFISFSTDPHAWTGNVVGFHVGASWSKYGLGSGGVMGRAEAKRLAEFILKQIEGIDESEADEIKRLSLRLMKL